MPSTVVHVALAGLIGTALLAEHFDGKAVVVVMAATAFVDLDTFLGFWIEGAHRAAFHTLLLPLLGAALLWWDLRGRAHPWVRSRLGGRSGSSAAANAHSSGPASESASAGESADAGERASSSTYGSGLAPAFARVRSWVSTRLRSWPSSRLRSRLGARPLVRERSLVRSRWGARGVRVAWVSLVAVTFSGIGLDAFFNGANLFYPVHDQFYDLSGKVFYSTKDGFVQTIVTVDLDALVDSLVPDEGALPGGETTEGANGGSKGGSNAESGGGTDDPAQTTDNTHYSTGVDPTKGDEPKQVERLFPIAYTGERALLALTGYTVVGLRVWLERRRE